MFWIQAAQAALSVIGARGEGKIVDARNRVFAAQAAAENTVRDAGNAFSLARSTAARAQQALNNNRALTNLGSGLEEQARNYARQRDMETRASFEDQIREAELSGEQAAMAAFSGVGGDAVDVVSGTTALRAARAEEEAKRYAATEAYDYRYARGAMIQSAISGLDGNAILDDLDYSTSLARQDQKPNALMAGLGTFIGNGGAASLAQMGQSAWGSMFKAQAPVGGSGFRAPGALESSGSYSFSFLPKETSRRL